MGVCSSVYIRTRYRLGRFVFGLTLAITDVAGPPVPAARFSSLPIRGADAATAGADESNLEVNCNMAPAFDILTGNWTATGRCSPAGAIQRVPGHASQIAAPGRPDPISWID